MSGIDVTKRYVRVTGTTPNGFVEFEFSIGDRALCVELLLSKAAFAGFCEVNNVEFVSAGDPAPGPQRRTASGLLRTAAVGQSK
jgi:phenol hydroxylase P0 protein